MRSVHPLNDVIFDLDIHTIPANKGVPEHLHYDIAFLFTATKQEPLSISNESIALEWVETSRIAEKNKGRRFARISRKLAAL